MFFVDQPGDMGVGSSILRRPRSSDVRDAPLELGRQLKYRQQIMSAQGSFRRRYEVLSEQSGRGV
jgi:hypothetical protein